MCSSGLILVSDINSLFMHFLWSSAKYLSRWAWRCGSCLWGNLKAQQWNGCVNQAYRRFWIGRQRDSVKSNVIMCGATNQKKKKWDKSRVKWNNVTYFYLLFYDCSLLLTWNVYTDGIVFNEWVFWMRKISNLSKPMCGIDSMDVFDKSLCVKCQTTIYQKEQTTRKKWTCVYQIWNWKWAYNSKTFIMPAKPFGWISLSFLLVLIDLIWFHVVFFFLETKPKSKIHRKKKEKKRKIYHIILYNVRTLHRRAMAGMWEKWKMWNKLK